MKILFNQPNSKHQCESTNLLSKSMIEDGHDVQITPYHKSKHGIEPDIAIFWGHRQRVIIENQLKNNKDYLVMERAYIGDRFKWYSLGYNGLNGRADFVNKDITDSSRWDKHFKKYLKPWKENIEHLPILLVGQVPTDAAVKHINIKEWYINTIKYYVSQGKKIIFRKHPLDRTSISEYDYGITIDQNEHLEDTLKQVSNCVTFSSNSGVISVLEGVPTIAADIGSMVYNLVPNKLNLLDQKPDRTDWCNKIAYTQWLPHEIESGLAWEHLKKRYDK